MATPALPNGLLKPFDPRVTHSSVRHAGLEAAQPCDLGQLAQLPRAHLFADLDIAPELLVRTDHSAVASGYHRNQARMREVILAFGGPLSGARGLVAANRANYLVACKGSADLAIFANMGEGNLADLIYADQPPEWLVEDKRFSSGSLRVYQVR